MRPSPGISIDYRDDLIHRLKTDGAWPTLSADTRSAIEAFGDDRARDCMVALDDGPPGPVAFGELRGCIQWFNGALLDMCGCPRVWTAGMLLAEFVRAQ